MCFYVYSQINPCWVSDSPFLNVCFLYLCPINFLNLNLNVIKVCPMPNLPRSCPPDSKIDMNICPICKIKFSNMKKPIFTTVEMYNNYRGYTGVVFELAVSNTTRYCSIFNDNIFSLIRLDDTFLWVVCEISQNTDTFVKLEIELRKFQPFEINEDKISDYHGELDLDTCYRNQYSRKLFRNYNFFVGEAFTGLIFR